MARYPMCVPRRFVTTARADRTSRRRHSGTIFIRFIRNISYTIGIINRNVRNTL